MVDGENEDGLKDIKEDGNAELNDGDNFIHKPKRQKGQFSFNRQDSTTGQMGERQESKGQCNRQFSFNRQDSTGQFGIQTIFSSPKRPMRSHHRQNIFPASPTGNNINESNGNNFKNSETPSTNNTMQTSSSFSRFLSDFEIVGTLGTGSFGSVYSVKHRTDQRLYAIKAAKREARGVTDRNRMMQEVYALASLSDKVCVSSMHIVRYHQAWMEGNRLYIQTELCDFTLEEEIRNGKNGLLVEEKRRYKLLREMLLALDLVHKSGMIHLDIKPENIFIKNDQYKLGDFGLVSKIENHEDVEEGDSRYMSMELLSGELDDLTKVSLIAQFAQ